MCIVEDRRQMDWIVLVPLIPPVQIDLSVTTSTIVLHALADVLRELVRRIIAGIIAGITKFSLLGSFVKKYK